jgi:simple sugar transport system substrate-binding protein
VNEQQRQRAEITRRVALAGGGAGLTAALLAACGSGGSPATTTKTTPQPDAAKLFGSSEIYKFTVVSHDIQGSQFVPLQYGLQDACTLLGCQYNWTGSRTSNVQTMVQDINQAVSAKVDGIATTLIEAGPFTAPIEAALAADIPVLAYESDVPGNPRMAFIGPDLVRDGELIGERITKLVIDGGEVALFAATPGTANVQGRIEGIKKVLRSRPDITLKVVATGTSTSSQSFAIQNFVQAHPKLAGYFAVDSGSTDLLAQALNSNGIDASSGGVDGSLNTLKLVQSGRFGFVVDQQTYLQGFMVIVELYLYCVSRKLVGIADVDTGIQLIDKTNVSPFVETMSRYQGTTSSPGVQKS